MYRRSGCYHEDHPQGLGPSSGSGQFADRLPFTEDGNGPAGKVLERGSIVNTEVAVDRRQQILGRQWPFLRMLPARVRGPDDLPHRETAAGDEGAVRVGPV